MTANTLHVHPLDDLIEHELTEDCLCGPRTRREVREDGTDAGWLIIHHSADGREKRERERQA